MVKHHRKSNKKAPQKDKTVYLAFSVLILITIIVFSNSINNEILYGWDDGVYIEDQNVRDISSESIGHYFSSYYLGMYQPLPVLAFGINYAMSGTRPASYHFINLLLHLLNVFLVFILIRKNTRRVEMSFFVALLFAIHPMHVESVSWIATRSNLLYAVFFLAALISYQNYLENPGKKKLYWFSFGWFLLACFSKSIAVTLPLILLLFDYLKNTKISWRLIIEKIPFFFVSVIFGLVAIKAASLSGHIENLQVDYNFIDRIFLVSYSLVFYLFKLSFPFHLSAIYSFPEKINGFLPWEYYASLIVILLIIFWIVRSKKYKRTLIFGFLFFVFSLSVVLPVVWSRIFITADRYTYIAYIGIFFIISKLFFDFYERKEMRFRKWRPYMTGFLVIYLLFFCVKSFNRNEDWKSTGTLLNHVIQNGRTDADVAAGYFYRGSMYDAQQEYRKAFEDYSSAIRKNPEYTLAFNNRGIIRGMMQDFEGALADFNKAIANKPDYAESYYNRGNVNYYLNRKQQACEDWRKSALLGFGQANKVLRDYCK